MSDIASGRTSEKTKVAPTDQDRNPNVTLVKDSWWIAEHYQPPRKQEGGGANHLPPAEPLLEQIRRIAAQRDEQDGRRAG
jgi:hypothetical protein